LISPRASCTCTRTLFLTAEYLVHTLNINLRLDLGAAKAGVNGLFARRRPRSVVQICQFRTFARQWRALTSRKSSLVAVFSVLPTWQARALPRPKVDKFVPHTQNISLRIDRGGSEAGFCGLSASWQPGSAVQICQLMSRPRYTFVNL